MKIRELYNELCIELPKSLSCDWDPDGFEVCPDSDAEVKKVLISLDVTNEVIEKAIKECFDVIISHHPLFFKGVGELSDTSVNGEKAIKLIRNGIGTMSFHTRLDAQTCGVNDILADLIGLENVETVENGDERIMRVGELVEYMPIEEFALMVKEKLDAGTVIVSPYTEKVRRVAVLGGSGGSDIYTAKACGADTYLTGEMKYSQLLSYDDVKMNLVIAGHYNTEFPVCNRLYELVKSIAPETYVEVFASNRIFTV